MIVGVVSPAMAKEGNNGNNGCEKSGNGKSCENNPNTPPAPTCETCNVEYQERNNVCRENFESNSIEEFFCFTASHEELKLCVEPPVPSSCQIPPAPSP